MSMSKELKQAVRNVLTSHKRQVDKGTLDADMHVKEQPIFEKLRIPNVKTEYQVRVQFVTLPKSSVYDPLEWIYYLNDRPVAHVEVDPHLYYTHRIHAGYILKGLEGSLMTGRRVLVKRSDEDEDTIVWVTLGDEVVIKETKDSNP